MMSYRKWQVGDRGNTCMGAGVPGNPASFVDVYLAKSSPVSSNSQVWTVLSVSAVQIRLILGC